MVHAKTYQLPTDYHHSIIEKQCINQINESLKWKFLLVFLNYKPHPLIFWVEKQLTIATQCPAVCRVEMAPDFCCGVKDALIRWLPMPTVFATLATASSLSPDNKIVSIPFCCSLQKVKHKQTQRQRMLMTTSSSTAMEIKWDYWYLFTVDSASWRKLSEIPIAPMIPSPSRPMKTTVCE